jgi:pimeloyl-ACP methyl ester carboxylesterase
MDNDQRSTRNRHVTVDGLDVWVEERGEGPALLLIAGLSDPLEAWQAQLDALADRYHLIAFDNPGAGRTALPDELSVALMADVAAGVLAEVGVEAAHVCGFSGGSVTAQEVAIRHPEVVRSLALVSTWSRPDPYFDTLIRTWTWMAAQAPDEQAMLEAFFLWIYTARAHENGLVEQVIKEAFEFPHPQAPEAFLAQLAAYGRHDAHDRLPAIDVPTLVVAGAEDIGTPPRLGRIVAEQIPGARFVVLDGEAHQPFQESPEAFNALVDAFWREVEA